MRRRLISLVLFVAGLGCFGALHAADDSADFVGVWQGEIIAPNTTTSLGVAFIDTERGLLVSLSLPEMFIYNVNFGAAEIRDGTFELAPLNLKLRRVGSELRGSFALAELPVTLRPGSAFPDAPEVEELPPAPAPRWQRALDSAVWASPIVHEGIVYVGTVDGRVHAIRATDGEPVWTWVGTAPLYGAALATNDAIYLVDERDDLVRLERATGKLRWRVSLRSDSAGENPANPTFTHRTAAPIWDGRDLLYVGSTDGQVHAIRARTGKIAWSKSVGAPLYAPLALHGDTLLAGAFDGTLVGFNRRTRAETLRVKLGGPIVSTPAVSGSLAIVGARDYLLYAVSLNDGRIAWRNSFWFSWVESSPRLEGGTLYIGSSDYRRVSALDPRTGAQKWATDVRGLTWGTPLVLGERVFAATAGQHLEGTVITHEGGIVALDRATGSVVWRYRAPVPQGADMSGFAGSLATDGQVVIGVTLDGTMMAFPAN